MSTHQNMQAPTKFPIIAANKALLGINAITGASVIDESCHRPQYNKNFFIRIQILENLEFLQ